MLIADDILPSLLGFQRLFFTVNEDTDFTSVCITVRVRSLQEVGEIIITSDDRTATSKAGTHIKIIILQLLSLANIAIKFCYYICIQ